MQKETTQRDRLYCAEVGKKKQECPPTEAQHNGNGTSDNIQFKKVIVMKIKNIKIKVFAAAIAAIMIIGSIALVSCDKESDNFTSREQLTAPYMDMVYSVDLDTFEVTTILKNEVETFVNLYLENFSTKAFVAWGISEMSPDSVDIYLIPRESQYANNIKAKFNALQNGAKLSHFHDKDKDKVNKWANEMMENGYIVVCYYDEKTKGYHALAYTKFEWALLNLK